jgi:hypothetical protein
MKIRALLFFIAILLVVSCETIAPKDITIQTKITDTEGTLIKEANADMLLQLTAEEFRELNKNDIFNKGAKILVDGIEAHVKEAKDNIVLLTLPGLYYVIPRDIVILLQYQQTRFHLCERCILYRPTVTGTVLAGISGSTSDGTFEDPAEMALDGSGNIYVIDQRSKNDVIIRVTPTGTTALFAGGAGEFGRLVGISVDGSRGRLYVSDATSQQIKMLSLTAPSTVTVFAGSGLEGNEDGTGTAASFRFGTDGVEMYNSGEEGQGMTIDGTGNIFVGERYTSASSSQARRITPDGVVTTVPGSRYTVPGDPDIGDRDVVSSSGVTLNGAGELVNSCGDPAPFHGITRLVGTTWTRIAGRNEREGSLQDGIGSHAKFSYPKALDYYGGYYYVADGSNGALRRVSESGTVTTLAGVGHLRTNEQSDPDVLPMNASYVMPSLALGPDAQRDAAGAIHMEPLGGVAAVSGNLIYVSDFGFKCIWKVTVR